jgi:hypothetical protein
MGDDFHRMAKVRREQRGNFRSLHSATERAPHSLDGLAVPFDHSIYSDAFVAPARQMSKEAEGASPAAAASWSRRAQRRSPWQRMRKGSPWLKRLLVQCAFAAVREKDSYYEAQFNRLRGRDGTKKAICVVAAAMLTAICHMLKNGTEHQDHGTNHFDRRFTEIKAT